MTKTFAAYYRAGSLGDVSERLKVVARACVDCGTGIPNRGGKKYCAACSAARLVATIARNRAKRAAKKPMLTSG